MADHVVLRWVPVANVFSTWLTLWVERDVVAIEGRDGRVGGGLGPLRPYRFDARTLVHRREEVQVGWQRTWTLVFEDAGGAATFPLVLASPDVLVRLDGWLAKARRDGGLPSRVRLDVDGAELVVSRRATLGFLRRRGPALLLLLALVFAASAHGPSPPVSQGLNILGSVVAFLLLLSVVAIGQPLPSRVRVGRAELVVHRGSPFGARELRLPLAGVAVEVEQRALPLLPDLKDLRFVRDGEVVAQLADVDVSWADACAFQVEVEAASRAALEAHGDGEAEVPEGLGALVERRCMPRSSAVVAAARESGLHA